jgi:acyl-CoA reductase-like NAD-dependent aldehyde dehydrogenase
MSESISQSGTMTGDMSADQMQDILQRQKQAYLADGVVSTALRNDRLERAVNVLKNNQKVFVEAMSADFGHRSEHQSIFTDIASAIGPIRHAQKHLAGWQKKEKRKVTPGILALLGAKAWVEYQPLGVVGVISPWNFPVNLTFTPLAGILAAGNRCMIKPSEYTPETSKAMAEAIAQEFDADEIAVITGGPETGANFSGLAFDHLLFTGATSVAKHVMRAAAANLVPVTLELGGKSPVVISRTAPMAATTDALMAGKMLMPDKFVWRQTTYLCLPSAWVSLLNRAKNLSPKCTQHWSITLITLQSSTTAILIALINMLMRPRTQVLRWLRLILLVRIFVSSRPIRLRRRC